MNIVVLNFSGNVGKSTVARHLLAPRLEDAKVIPVETINSDGTEDETVRGRQFGDLVEAIAVMDGDVVVDVGASNVEEFLGQMRQYRGSHEDFDYFVVPVVPRQKQIRDTISTITAVAEEVGVPAKKIRLVFNMVEHSDNPEAVFGGLFAFHKAEKLFTLRPDAVIHNSDIFGKLGGNTIAEVLDDATDLKAELKNATNSEDKVRISRRIAIKRLAVGVTEELDAVFKTLFK